MTTKLITHEPEGVEIIINARNISISNNSLITGVAELD